MSKWRKKPIIIEAEQWQTHLTAPNAIVSNFVDEYSGNTLCKICDIEMRHHGWIKTIEGGLVVCPGDWIITGIAGEHYPCKPHIFSILYEPVIDTGK